MCAYAVSYVEIFKGIQKIIFQKRKVKKQRKEKKAKKNPTLKTPANVSTSPLPAPTKNTAAIFNKNAIAAFVISTKGPKLNAS